MTALGVSFIGMCYEAMLRINRRLVERVTVFEMRVVVGSRSGIEVGVGI
jgi:hypothetical protein